MEYYVPKSPLLDNNEFSIYGVSNLKEYASQVMEYLMCIKKNILQFFEIDHYDKVRINLYDSREDILKWRTQFGNAPYKIGNNAGFFYDNMVFCYSDSSKVDVMIAIKNVAHEFVHLVYMNAVQEQGNEKRVVWVDEGLAQLLSGQKEDLLDKERFKIWFMNHILGANKEIPNINFLKQHGSEYGSFCDTKTNKYNGYDFSYVLIRYLLETVDKTEFQRIIRNKDLIEKLESTIIESAVSYYIKSLNIESETFIQRKR